MSSATLPTPMTVGQRGELLFPLAVMAVLVVNNGMYGSIRMHQEKRYPNRVSGTQLASPDYVALARSFGAHAERVSRTEDFAGAFSRANAHVGLALLEFVTDPQQILPITRIASSG